MICCSAQIGCGAKKYSRSDLVGTAIDGDELVLFIDVVSGTRQWEMPDSPNRTGVTITEHSLFRVEYHLGDTRATRAQFLFKEPDRHGRYELKPIQGGGTLVVKHFSNESTEVFSFLYPSNFSQCVIIPVEGEISPRHEAAILTTSNTLLIHNDSKIRMFELPSLNEVADDPILQVLRTATADMRIGEYRFALSDDRRSCAVYSDDDHGQDIQVYNANGKMQRVKTASSRSSGFLQVASVNGKLMWLCQDERTIIGNFLDNTTYETSIGNYPRWDFAHDRVLFKPMAFDCYGKDNFQNNWNLWYYKKNEVKTFSLDYTNLLNQLDASRR